jgi:hypothetical protein
MTTFLPSRDKARADKRPLIPEPITMASISFMKHLVELIRYSAISVALPECPGVFSHENS